MEIEGRLARQVHQDERDNGRQSLNEKDFFISRHGSKDAGNCYTAQKEIPDKLLSNMIGNEK